MFRRLFGREESAAYGYSVYSTAAGPWACVVVAGWLIILPQTAWESTAKFVIPRYHCTLFGRDV